MTISCLGCWWRCGSRWAWRAVRSAIPSWSSCRAAGRLHASRSAVTLIYSFALLVGGIARRSRAGSSTVSAACAYRYRHDGRGTRHFVGIFATPHLASLCSARHRHGLCRLLAVGVLSATLIGRWFPAQRLGVALAVAWSAAGVGTMGMLPLAHALIATDGWRHAYIVFALISAAFIPLLLVLPWRRISQGAAGLRPARASAKPGPTVIEACADWPFWALTASFGFTSLGIFSLVPQTVVYLRRRGFDGAYAARAIAVAGFLTPLGMIGFSWLADRGGRRLAAILAYASSIAGVGALSLVRGSGDDLWLWLYVVLFGGSMGSRGPMISTLATLRYSRRPCFGRIYGLIGIGMGIGRISWCVDWRPAARLTGGYAA